MSGLKTFKTTLFLVITLMTAVRPASAAVVTLEFTNLPSAQGWVFASNPNTAISELQNYSLTTNDPTEPGGILHGDSTTRNPEFAGSGGDGYTYYGPDLFDGPFQIHCTARVTESSGEPYRTSEEINPFGFTLYFSSSTGAAYFAITTNLVATDMIGTNGQETGVGLNFTVTGDNTSFHDYLFEGNIVPGGTFSVYRDGVPVLWSPVSAGSPDSPVAVNFGSISGGAVAIADIAAFSCQTGNPEIYATKALKLNFCNLYIGDTYQLQSSLDLMTWTDSGSSFPATATSSYQYVDVSTFATFWRLKQVQ